MHIEVDQSGRIEFTKEDTVLAFANGKAFSILISATTKRACVRRLRAAGLSGPSLYTRLFAVGLFFLLKEHLQRETQVVIDTEYFGREPQIKEHLINLLRRAGYEVDAQQIQFRQIGKKSPAHKRALATLRGDKEPSRIVSLDEVMEQFAGK